MSNNSSLTPDSIALTERVKQVKRINKIKNTTIADISGVGRPTISNQLNGRWNLDVRVLLAVAKLSPNISAEWLLRGEGDILIGGDKGIAGIESRLARIESFLKSK